MISAPNLKFLKSYLSGAEGISAIYDENLVLQWSDCDDFFEKIDISDILSKEIFIETHFTVPYGDSSATLTVTPIFKSKRIIDAYAVTVKNAYQIYKMLDCSPIRQHAVMGFEEILLQAEQLLKMNKVLSDIAEGQREIDILNSQNRILSSIKTDMDSLSKAVFAETKDITVNCNISYLFNAICREAEIYLKDIKRKLTADLDTKCYYIKINYELFSVAIANIFNYHLKLSPLKSTIQAFSACAEEKLFKIVIKSKYDAAELSEQDMIRCDFRRSLAEKIIKMYCMSDFKCTNDKKTLVTELSMPIYLKNRGSMLSVNNSAYLDPNYKPMRDLMKKTVESEIERLEEIKMETAKKKKLDSLY